MLNKFHLTDPETFVVDIRGANPRDLDSDEWLFADFCLLRPLWDNYSEDNMVCVLHFTRAVVYEDKLRCIFVMCRCDCQPLIYTAAVT